METKKFLWWLVATSTLCLILSSCQSRRKGRPQGVHKPIEEQPVEITQPQQRVEKPQLMQRQAPRLGLILGGGGVLSYGQIGFLQELEAQKIPVFSIAGVEWGALVSGAYAMAGKAHAVEWKLLKLPHKKFHSTSFFSSGKSGAKVSAFDSYLAEIFKSHQFSDLKIPFSCASLNLKSDKSYVQARGLVRNSVRNCWGYPPHFKVSTVTANLEGIHNLARRMKQNGAEVVIYVDVISLNKLMSGKAKKTFPQAHLAWVQHKNFVSRLDSQLIDDVIRIPLSGKTMTSYQSMRSIIKLGQTKSKGPIKTLVKKYAY